MFIRFRYSIIELVQFVNSAEHLFFRRMGPSHTAEMSCECKFVPERNMKERRKVGTVDPLFVNITTKSRTGLA